MSTTKTAFHILIRALSLAIGAAFPFTSALWKIMILIAFFGLRVIDVEREKKLFGVTSLFFIGMVIGYTCRLIWP